MIKGAIFDMDGLMFDTERLVYENWLRMMTELGYSYDLDFFKLTVGKRKKETARIYLEAYGADFPYWKLADMGKAMYIERVRAEGIPVKKGLFDILNYLKGKDISIALATSTSKATASMNLDIAGVTDYFDALVCGEDVKNGKPHPEVFLTASERLGLEPCECLAFEDSINGIKSAHAAGNVTVMVPDFLQPTEELVPMIDYLCADLERAIDVIKL